MYIYIYIYIYLYIYIYIQTVVFQVLQEYSSWASGNGAVQIFFFESKQTHVRCKSCKKIRKVFGYITEHVIFSV